MFKNVKKKYEYSKYHGLMAWLIGLLRPSYQLQTEGKEYENI